MSTTQKGAAIGGLEHMHWAAVFTAECGFSSAVRLRRLFPFLERIKGVIVRENKEWDPSCE